MLTTPLFLPFSELVERILIYGSEVHIPDSLYWCRVSLVCQAFKPLAEHHLYRRITLPRFMFHAGQAVEHDLRLSDWPSKLSYLTERLVSRALPLELWVGPTMANASSPDIRRTAIHLLCWHVVESLHLLSLRDMPPYAPHLTSLSLTLRTSVTIRASDLSLTRLPALKRLRVSCPTLEMPIKLPPIDELHVEYQCLKAPDPPAPLLMIPHIIFTMRSDVACSTLEGHLHRHVDHMETSLRAISHYRPVELHLDATKVLALNELCMIDLREAGPQIGALQLTGFIDMQLQVCTLPTQLRRLTLDEYGLSATTSIAQEIERIVSLLPNLTSLTVEYNHCARTSDPSSRRSWVQAQELWECDSQQLERFRATHSSLKLHVRPIMISSLSSTAS